MNTDSYRLAYRAGQEAARSDFEKNANKLLRGVANLAGGADPRKALSLAAGTLVGTAALSPFLMQQMIEGGHSGASGAAAEAIEAAKGRIGRIADLPEGALPKAHAAIDDINKAIAQSKPGTLSQPIRKGLLAALGAGTAMTAATAGSANPGLTRQTSLIPRLSSEFAAAAQTPGGMAKSLALLLGVPYGLYQLGKKVGENESSIF
tara:strand:- start:921 stop:1538 length:618 start_codon:yes stop_codon:yes gene_type:complete